jgi:hypothetical protein
MHWESVPCAAGGAKHVLNLPLCTHLPRRKTTNEACMPIEY